MTFVAPLSVDSGPLNNTAPFQLKLSPDLNSPSPLSIWMEGISLFIVKTICVFYQNVLLWRCYSRDGTAYAHNTVLCGTVSDSAESDTCLDVGSREIIMTPPKQSYYRHCLAYGVHHQ